MPGVFITQGADFRLSDIQMPTDGSPPLNAVPSLRMDTWQHWLLVACDNTVLATSAEARLHQVLAEERAAGGVERGAEKGEELEAEFRAAMTCVAACGFAIDAFYGAVRERFGPHPDAAAWSKNRLARHKQIADTLHYRLKLKGSGMPVIRQFLEELFRFRGAAVHPATHFADPIYRQDLDAGVEPRFITYSAEHARQVLGRTVELMTVLIPKAADAAADGENAQWAVFAGGRIGVIRGKALAIAGVQVGPEESEQEERVEGPPK